MNQNSKLILPILPENLENLKKQEEKIRSNSILLINADSVLKDHIDIVYKSLNLLHDLTISYKNQTDDELTIQFLGIRLFNSIISSIKLLLDGYYQGSVIFQRDTLEVGFLLDYFLIFPEKVTAWKNSNKQDRFNKYRPSIIRKALDNRDGFQNKNRTKKYQIMCEYAAHASYPGFKLVAPKKLVKMGPFIDLNYLKFLIQELSMNVPLFTIICLRHFKKLPSSFTQIQNDYQSKIEKWGHNYLNLEFENDGFEIVKEWMIAITKSYV